MSNSKENNNKTGPKVPELTTRLQLVFNINNFRRWMKDYYTNNEMLIVFTKKDKNETELKAPSLRGAYVAIASLTEILCQELLTRTAMRSNKDQTGLYSLSKQALLDEIKTDKELDYVFGRYANRYTDGSEYKFANIDLKQIRHYVDRNIGGNIKLSHESKDKNPKFFNFLIYLVMSVAIEVTELSYAMCVYAKKKSIDFRVVEEAIKFLFKSCGDDTMRHKIIQKLGSTKSLFDEYNNENRECDDDGDDKNADDKDKDKDAGDDNADGDKDKDTDNDAGKLKSKSKSGSKKGGRNRNNRGAKPKTDGLNNKETEPKTDGQNNKKPKTDGQDNKETEPDGQNKGSKGSKLKTDGQKNKDAKPDVQNKGSKDTTKPNTDNAKTNDKHKKNDSGSDSEDTHKNKPKSAPKPVVKTNNKDSDSDSDVETTREPVKAKKSPQK